MRVDQKAFIHIIANIPIVVLVYTSKIYDVAFTPKLDFVDNPTIYDKTYDTKKV